MKIKTNEDIILNNVLKVSETDKGKLIDFFLINEIEDIEDYIDFLREVSSARDNDLVRIHINCYGGDLNTALNIYDILKETEASVEIDVEGLCASAATMIMLAGNTWKVFPHSKVMIHAWTSFQYGKWNELQEQFKFDKDVWESQFKEIYKNFLTEDEIQKCIDGKDFWFSSDETVKRLNDFQADTMAKQEKMKEIMDKYQKLMSDEFKNIDNIEKVESPKSRFKKSKKLKKSEE